MAFLAFIATKTQADAIAKATAGEDARIEPRPIEAGEYAGKFAIGAQNANNPAFESAVSKLEALPIVWLDTDEAWPSQE
jgi:hypothetical protein